MNVSLRQVHGPWDDGWVLDKHSLGSICVGHNAYGHPVFETTRTEVGEATFQLKYRSDWSQAAPLAQAIASYILPKLPKIGFIIPMPASTYRPRQPVNEVANELGRQVNVPVFNNILLRAAGGKSLKDVATKEEKIEILKGGFSIQDMIPSEGVWDVLIVDDLFHTGASLEAACQALRGYPKVRRIYAAALTWRD